MGFACRTLLAAIAMTIGLGWPGSKSAQADQIRLLPGHQEALQARADLIQQAEYQIDCAYYAVDTGRVPAAVLQLLAEAAQRGVRVRLLVDGLMSRLPLGLHEHLCSQGVEVCVYRPPNNLHPILLNRRMHDKLLIVDRQSLVMGSRNLQDAHFGRRSPGFIDCDAVIEGSSAEWAADYFEWIWNHGHVEPLKDMNLIGQSIFRLLPNARDDWSRHWRAAKSDQDYAHLLQASLEAVVAEGMLQLETGNAWNQTSDPDVELEFVHEADTGKQAKTVQRRLQELIHNAQSSLLIQTPYPVFTRYDLEQILETRRRGVRVVLCTNSLQTTDRLATYSDFENFKGVLLEAGIEIYEAGGTEHLHNKAVVIDDCIAVIGSYNFDERSANLNMEVGMIAYSPDVARQVREIIESQMASGFRTTESPALLEPSPCGASTSRRLKMELGRLLVPTFRWLL